MSRIITNWNLYIVTAHKVCADYSNDELEIIIPVVAKSTHRASSAVTLRVSGYKTISVVRTETNVVLGSCND